MSNPFSKGTQTPPAPDYSGAAAAQGTANQQSATQTQQLNNPNVVNPYGTQNWSMGADGRPTVTQTLSPEQQNLLNQQNTMKASLGQTGINQAGVLNDTLGKPVDFSGAPGTPGSYEDTRKKVIDASMGRANEDYAKQTDQANSDLIARGIRPGTKAYADNQQMIERSRNDARTQAEIAGGNAATQAYQTDAARRQAGISEILQQRSTPLNEMTALQSGSQVTNPYAMPGASQNTSMAPAPVFGAAQATADYNQNQANAGNAQQGNFMNGLFGLGSSYLLGGGLK